MAKIQRLYDFQNGTRADAEQVDAEFDNLIQAHNDHDDELLKKVDETGDFKGTWNGHDFEEADPFISSRVTAIENMVKEEEKATVTLVRGENIVEAPENASLQVLEIQGDEVKNLATLFDSGLWSGTDVTLNSPEKITIVADGTEKVYQTTVNVVPNMTYFLSGVATLEGTHIEAVVSSNTIQAPAQVVVPLGVTSVTVRCVVTNTAQGTATFEQVQLAVSDVEREFVAGYQPLRNPYIEIDNGSYLYFDEYLYKDDKLYQDNQGDWRKKQNKIETNLTPENVKTVTVEHYAGGKALKFLVSEIMPSASTFDQEVIKWNGMYLTRTDSSANQTNNRYYLDATHLVLFVASTDTGWGDKPADPTDGTPIPEPIPSKQEVLAFLQGWKMAHNDGTTPYIEAEVSTKGAKKWTKVMEIGESTTLPQESYFGWNPFKVIYKTSSEQDVPAKHEGSLRLEKGANKVTLGEGLVLREKANPVLSEDKYYIGDSDVMGSQTKFPISSVLEVFRRGKKDNWALGENAQLDKALFDSFAQYNITYKARNRYEISCYAGCVESTHTVNFHMESRENTDNLNQLEKRVSNLEMVLLNRLGKRNGVPILGPDGIPLSDNGASVDLKYKTIDWATTTADSIIVPRYVASNTNINHNKYTKKIPLKIFKTISRLRINVMGGGNVENQQSLSMDYLSYFVEIPFFKKTEKVWLSRHNQASSINPRQLVPFNKNINPVLTVTNGGQGIPNNFFDSLAIHKIYFSEDMDELIIVLENGSTTVDRPVRGRVFIEIWGM